MAFEARFAENRTRLVSHFDDYKSGALRSATSTRDAQGDGWAKLWEKNEQDLWDRGQPSPALTTFLEEHPYRDTLFQDKTQRRLKAFVPGSGKGHDVALLARHGFKTWGFEIFQGVVDAANENINIYLDPSADHYANVVLGDFFKKDIEAHLGPDFQGFDLIYDYTMRKDWAERMKTLLSPIGVLVCLEFPMWKPLKDQGPPWGLNGVHWNLLADGANGLFDESGNLLGNDQEEGSFERVVYWKPPFSFKQSRGDDMLSVWRLKQ
ncbi:hypothetical protein G6011_01582 [Alternaria panax]|uniref:Uncharacterized protein n=1 Tax=Alternaria panax TaxID=48097 RepID=A0AAD4NUP0_9PLEO|nr:hypothetical protein G6011_01582 [Alternaria panax]